MRSPPPWPSSGRAGRDRGGRVYLASEYADSLHGTTLTIDGGRLPV